MGLVFFYAYVGCLSLCIYCTVAVYISSHVVKVHLYLKTRVEWRGSPSHVLAQLWWLGYTTRKYEMQFLGPLTQRGFKPVSLRHSSTLTNSSITEVGRVTVAADLGVFPLGMGRGHKNSHSYSSYSPCHWISIIAVQGAELPGCASTKHHATGQALPSLLSSNPFETGPQDS